jgi:glyoxylase I family protein
MALTGVSHVGLTVTDLDRSCNWYRDILGWQEMMRDRGDTTAFAYGALPGGLTLVLRQHDQPAAGSFDEARAGLDHLSVSVESITDVEALEKRLEEAGARFSPRVNAPYGTVLSFRDPDNIALEVMLAPS